MMLQACLNGGRSKAEAAGVPVSHAELAADAAAVRRAGADELHLHPRNADGHETLDPEEIAGCLRAVRAAVPGMPVGVGTGAWIAPGGAARLELIARWTELPDYASVNLSEPDAPETMRLLRSKGVGIEAGLWTAVDAERFVRLPDQEPCVRVLIEMTSDDPVAAEAEYQSVRRILVGAGIKLPILLHGEGGSVWPMIERAAHEGHDTRVGFEDGLLLPDGQPADSNAQLVRAAIELSLGVSET